MSIISNRRNQPEQKILRQTLRNNATSAEACLWRALKGKQIDGLKFRRQFGFGPYVLDFYCPEIRLCIELDGEIHKSYDIEMYDIARTEFLRKNNVKVIRFDNDVVFRNTEGIIEEIKRWREIWINNSKCWKTLENDQTTPNPSYSGGECLGGECLEGERSYSGGECLEGECSYSGGEYSKNDTNVPRET